MNKIYRYRPLSNFLFKELFYQELFFASHSELNDPLDLSARVEFTPKDKNDIEYLLWFIFKAQFNRDTLHIPDENLGVLLKFDRGNESHELLINVIYKNIASALNRKHRLWSNDIIEIIRKSIKDANLNIVFDASKFQSELDRLTCKFLKNSHVVCFSETKDNFLMWSHYASRHSGICLEFSLENAESFPFELHQARPYDLEKFKERNSEWDTKSFILWETLRKVSYQEEQPFINFYKFGAVFNNENDCDLIGLSKSWTHKYSDELEEVFSYKTKSWKYEKEWRAIEINFDSPKEPENRIRHFPIECVSAVYFGVNTPGSVKNRVYKILSIKKSDIEFFESNLNGSDSIDFTDWDYNGE